MRAAYKFNSQSLSERRVGVRISKASEGSNTARNNSWHDPDKKALLWGKGKSGKRSGTI